MRFSVKNKSENGFDKIVLLDEFSGTFAEIIPACGAILYSFNVNSQAGNLNVIESYESADDFNNNVESKGFRGCKLSPFVCRLNKGKYHFLGTDYELQKFYLNDHAIHGLIYNAAFIVTDQNASDKKASVTMQYLYKAFDAGFPFNYACSVTYELETENKLNVITVIENKSDSIFPLQDGWHPYFKLSENVDNLQIQFQSKNMVEFNTELLPTGKLTSYQDFKILTYLGNTFFDNCFTLNLTQPGPKCILRNTEKMVQVEIYPDDCYPYLQIYIPPHRRSISLENLSSAPDAFNNGMGLKTLSPGESAYFKTGYKITLLT